jgi:hypothetical protein
MTLHGTGHDEQEVADLRYANYSTEPQGYTLTWKMLVAFSASIFVLDNTYDLSRPTQVHLRVFGHGSPI